VKLLTVIKNDNYHLAIRQIKCNRVLPNLAFFIKKIKDIINNVQWKQYDIFHVIF